jgi:hypothetical protein
MRVLSANALRCVSCQPQNQVSVAKLVGQRPSERKPRIPGNCQGMITLAVEDDEHLKDFAEYMP